MSEVETQALERAVGGPDEPPWRTLEYFATTRVIVASALVLGAAAVGLRQVGGSAATHSALFLALGYFVGSALFAGLALYWRRHFLAQVFGQLTVDMAAVTALVLAAGGVASGWVILYLLPLYQLTFFDNIGCLFCV